ncbi:MAG TPA: YezD family protein [Methylomirabilota bacterium]|nr:YezD family protein [Methylomirabilota bacterium]
MDNSLNLRPVRATNPPAPVEPNSEFTDWIKIVKQSLSGLQFGVVQIVVHGGRIVQIEKTEKLRVDQQIP